MRINSTHNPEKRLYRAVIVQAFKDCVNKDPDPREIAARNHAQAWLTGWSKDFREVCHLSGLCAYAINERAKQVIEKGDYNYA